MDAPSSSGAGASNAPPAQPPLSPLSFCERLERDTKEDESFDPMFVVGICLAMLSALISSVALIVMKRSADIEEGPPFRVVRCAAPWLPAACLSAGCISAELAQFACAESSHLLAHRWCPPIIRFAHRKRWWLGFIMNTASEVSLSFYALSLAPLVAPCQRTACDPAHRLASR